MYKENLVAYCYSVKFSKALYKAQHQASIQSVNVCLQCRVRVGTSSIHRVVEHTIHLPVYSNVCLPFRVLRHDWMYMYIVAGLAGRCVVEKSVER